METIAYSNPQSLTQRDLAEIGAAKKTLDMAAYSLTHRAIIEALIQRATAGVTIRLYLDHTELAASIREAGGISLCPIARLLYQPGVTIKVKASTVLMHLKSYCVDGIRLRDGSANLTVPGEEQQDNSATWSDDAGLCLAFGLKFDQMWNRPDNITPQAVAATAPAQHQSSKRTDH